MRCGGWGTEQESTFEAGDRGVRRMAEGSLDNVIHQADSYCIEKVAVDEAERLPREKGSRCR